MEGAIRQHSAPSWQRALTLILLLFGIARVFALVLHTPLYGYANNFDFMRVSHWYSLWPAVEGDNVRSGHPVAPLPHYRQGPDVLDRGYGTPGFAALDHRAGYFSSDQFFIDLALKLAFIRNILLDEPFNEVPLKTVGIVRALALVIVAVFFTQKFFSISQGAGLLSGALFAFVMSDPAWLLTLNTLYVDFSALLFVYVALASLLILFEEQRPSVAIEALFIFALIGLAFSKPQYMFLPLLLIAFGSVVLSCMRRRSRLPVPAAFLLLSVLSGSFAAFVQYRQLQRGDFIGVMRLANKTDTYLGAVLPAASDQDEALRILKLPKGCGSYIGKNWYSPGMQPSPCPELERVSLFDTLRLFVSDPATLFAPLAEGLRHTRPFYYNRVGQVAGGVFERYPANTSPLTFSVAALVEHIPIKIYERLLAGVLLGAVACFAIVAGTLLAGRAINLFWFYMTLLSLILVYSYGSAIFGDGYFDLDRHFMLGQLSLLLLLISLVFRVAAWKFPRFL